LSPRITLTNAPYSLNRAAAPVETESSNANTCTINVVTANQGGFTSPITYSTNSLSSGNLYIGLTFRVQSPATSGLTSSWQFVYGTGTAPSCDTTVSGGTTVGRQYSIKTQAAAAGLWGQSIGIVITNLIPSTTYWFDVQVTDSSAGSWIYSNQQLSLSDILSAVNVFPNSAENDNANSCGRNTAANAMAGLGVTYATLPSASGSGDVRLALSFNASSAAAVAAGATSKWQIAYGTGAAPSCNATAAGTIVGRQYTITQQAAVLGALEQSGSVVIQGLTAATTYWFDVQITDSSAAVWTYSNPTLAISEEANPNGGNIPNNVVYPLSAQTAACATTAAASSMAGLKEVYTLISTSKGNIYGTLTVNVLASNTIAAGKSTAFKVAYSDINTATMPACAAATVGTAVGQTISFQTITSTAYQSAATIQFVITGLTAGKTYWFDLQVTNTGTTMQWTFSNPTLTIKDIQSAGILEDNDIFLKGNSPSCTIGTSGSARMGGLAVIPTTANPPIEYQTLSYGSGNIQVTLSMSIATAATSGSTYAFQLTYGTVTDGTANPACSAAAVGTTVGNQYTWTNVAATAGTYQATVTVVITGLGHGTLYWFDFQTTNSVTTAANTIPQIQIREAA